MNGFAGSSRPNRLKQELAASNGAVPTLKRVSGDRVVGLAVRIVEIRRREHGDKSGQGDWSAFSDEIWLL